ncbi:copper resistance protein CopC [Micromonospora orduensis]|uniref:Copper resistance protein CopC n=1 Tax=Micromonospora orduensis TaxID=1420891 RepID=A0A5C4QQU9_9ACTN|nr:copper resistance CopC family protein [Micromonospora orduensis]TNH28036.1 copper resistance protein CopC [Micromonospora orduensis]
MNRTTRWGRLAAAAGAVVVVAIGVLMYAGSRGADLGPVYPADGAALREPPHQVSLTFDEAVQPAQIHIGVSDGSGHLVPSGAPVVSGAKIDKPVTIQADGDYVLAYHVVLADGRTFTGTNRFRVSSSIASPAAPADAAQPAAGGHDHFGSDPLSVVLTVVAAGSVIALLVMLIHRPQPRRP